LRWGSQKNLHCARRFSDYVACMDWQQIVSLAIVAVVAAALLQARFRRRKFGFGRNLHCGCSFASLSPTQGSIVFHARKGERPQVLVKMK
jgi:hypothetical protein